MVDNAPRHELPSVSSIEFQAPSAETHHALDHGLRWGADLKIRLAHEPLPEPYPFSTIDVIFEGGRYETPNETGQITPKWVSWYDIDIAAQLRDPKAFTEDVVRRISMALQSNTGKGSMRTLDNGHSQITIPDQSAMTPYDVYKAFNTEQPDGKPVTVLDFGVTDPEKGIAYYERNRDGAYLTSDYKYYDKKLAELREGVGVTADSLRIGLKSHYFTKFGNNAGFEGRLDRRFGIDPLHPDHHPFDLPDRHLGVYSSHIVPYFLYSGYMLQAVCDEFGARNLPNVVIPVEIPSPEDKSAWDAEQEIPPAFKDFLNGLGFV